MALCGAMAACAETCAHIVVAFVFEQYTGFSKQTCLHASLTSQSDSQLKTHCSYFLPWQAHTHTPLRNHTPLR